MGIQAFSKTSRQIVFEGKQWLILMGFLAATGRYKLEVKIE
jgi:hypothetical protein